MTLSVVVALHVRIGDLTIRAFFLVAGNLAVNSILGTAFTDRHVSGILPKEKRVIFRQGEKVTLLGSALGPEGVLEVKKCLPKGTTSSKNSSRLLKRLFRNKKIWEKCPPEGDIFPKSFQCPPQGDICPKNKADYLNKNMLIESIKLFNCLPHCSLCCMPSSYGAMT